MLFDRLLATAVPLMRASPSRKAYKRARTVQNDRLDAFLGRVATTVLVPLVSSMPALSRAFLSALLQPKPKMTKSAGHDDHGLSTRDLRPSVMRFISDALSSLRQQCINHSGDEALTSSVRSVCSLLMLAAVRSLESLGPPPRISGTTHVPQQAQAARAAPRSPDRLQRLVHKDAVWYLCSVVHLAMTAPGTSPATLSTALSGSGSGSSPCTYTHAQPRSPAQLASGSAEPQRLLAEDALAGLLRCRAWGEAERAMVLAAAEALWLAQA